MINFVYPLIISDWEELRYSLRSLEKYCQEDFEVYIVGDYLPSWIDNVKYIETERLINPYEDTGNKLKVIADLLEDFVWMSDDMFFLKPVTLEDLKQQKIVPKNPAVWPLHTQTTVEILELMDLDHEVYDYATHAPRYYESDELKRIDEQWPIFNGILNPEFLYYNLFGEQHPDFVDDRLYINSQERVIVKQEHKYLNIGTNGMSEAIKDYLAYRFDIQSKFEKSLSADKRNIPQTELVEQAPEGVLVKYIGRKKDFKFDAYDFSNGPVKVFPEYAQKMVTEYPRTFKLVS